MPKSKEVEDSGPDFGSLLDIDETDKQIITLLQDNPDMTHSDIADKVGKSQPAVGARIIKLKRKNLLATQLGVNFKEVDLKLVKVELSTRKVNAVLEKMSQCPMIINCFKISGENNLCILLGAPDIRTIDEIVDRCLRSDPNVDSVSTNFIISAVKKLVLPISFKIEHFREYGCGPDCFLNRDPVESLQDLTSKSLSREDYREVKEDD